MALGFAFSWLLWSLILLPILWLILRAVPPAPIRRRFPGVVLLLGLADDESLTHRTPWWLLLLRMMAMAAIIVGLAGPVLNPTQRNGETSNLLIVTDGSWATAQHWKSQAAQIDTLLGEAGRAGRPVALMQLTDPDRVQFQSADVWMRRLPDLEPLPWEPTSLDDIPALLGNESFDTIWLSDGLARDSRTPLLEALDARGTVEVIQPNLPVIGLAPVQFEDGAIQLLAQRSTGDLAQAITVLAQGRDPAGVQRVLASADLQFDPGATQAETALSLPAELRGRISRFEIRGVASAGAVSVSDDSLRRSEIALISGRDDREGLELLSPLHYLTRALAPNADLLHGALTDILPANPDVVVLADMPSLTSQEETALTAWVKSGGMLLRFAGPKLAASDLSRASEHILMPVRLRSGGRNVGGAMSWGAPKALAPFTPDSPFFGLTVPDDVKVTAQVVAQPDPTLADRVIAELSDGTPLVTRKALDQGQVVLFHVTANAEWSGLPLSGLFVEMLERLAISGSAELPDAESLQGTFWQPRKVLDGGGRLHSGQTLPGVAGEKLVEAPLSADLRPGLYQDNSRHIARNVMTRDRILIPAKWPQHILVRGVEQPAEQDLSGTLLALALLLLSLDIIASLFLSGRLRGARVALLFFTLPLISTDGHAQDDAAIAATREVTLAHIMTGDRSIDDRTRAGMKGLSKILFFRTSVEPEAPASINLETSELAFFPLLYWPITPSQPIPSVEAYKKLNAYLRNGGMILFDTADADVAGFGSASPNGRRLQQLAAPLDIPPLEPLPGDHVLTRTFYLLQDWPGRYNSHEVWVEAATPGAEQIEGMPFRNLNDGVTPVVIGGNDWAGAWAMDDRGNALYPVGRGRAGERQRELAYRFGVNLVMHVLTGNYKSDQVHVPALLERLGQ